MVCDRCGHRLDHNGEGQSAVRVSYKDRRRRGIQVDLCGTCSTGFENWMASRRLDRRGASSSG